MINLPSILRVDISICTKLNPVPTNVFSILIWIVSRYLISLIPNLIYLVTWKIRAKSVFASWHMITYFVNFFDYILGLPLMNSSKLKTKKYFWTMTNKKATTKCRMLINCANIPCCIILFYLYFSCLNHQVLYWVMISVNFLSF